MLKIFTFLALISLLLNANDHVQINCEEVYDKCATTCEEKTPNDDTCYAKCEVKFDKCVSDENEMEEPQSKDSK